MGHTSVVTIDTETELIKACQQGDRAAFNQLMLTYKDTVFTLCLRFLGNYDEAHDCAQDIFVKLFLNIRQFNFGSQFTTWLYRITFNTCNTKHSVKKKHTNTVSMSTFFHNGDEDTHTKDIPDRQPSVVRILEGRERDAIVQRCIQMLPKKFRQVLIMRDIQGCPYEEIAAVVGCELGTVKSRIARARQTLKILWESISDFVVQDIDIEQFKDALQQNKKIDILLCKKLGIRREQIAILTVEHALDALNTVLAMSDLYAKLDSEIPSLPRQIKPLLVQVGGTTDHGRTIEKIDLRCLNKAILCACYAHAIRKS